MRNEEIIIDLADPVFTKTIRSRQNDKNGLKITVYVREKGQLVDLTGYTVKYEAINQVGLFVRDDAQIVDAKNGVFSYTLSSQAVSTSDDWTAYFVMEKNTERMSTPDIRITLRRDVKEGNIKIENYISEFDGAMERVKGYRKEIDDANQKIKEIAPYIDEQYLKTNKKIEELGASIAANSVVKKAGDTMTGALVIETQDSKTSPLYLKNTAGVMRILPYEGEYNYIQSGTVDSKAKNLLLTGMNGSVMEKVQVKTKELWIEGTVKQATDTRWIPLLITGAEGVPDRILKYKRSGDQVFIIGSVTKVSNVQVFATLPAGCRPVQVIAFPALAYGNLPAICEVTVKSDGGIFVNGVQSGNTVHIAVSFSV
ncbi:BppU family phage baseplate upper protein [Bacillus cereus]|uniref:DUF2479 domain-containing protein n=1 Tax=Bacillus cereus TaxID=1396 RepID=A0A9X7QN83_BACCE|nr:BppU family phage baseplate upper protein [Bacillus cereus]QDZ77304.1 DUF2479 domain-containing protein [Bacillus cereus]